MSDVPFSLDAVLMACPCRRSTRIRLSGGIAFKLAMATWASETTKPGGGFVDPACVWQNRRSHRTTRLMSLPDVSPPLLGSSTGCRFASVSLSPECRQEVGGRTAAEAPLRFGGV